MKIFRQTFAIYDVDTDEIRMVFNGFEEHARAQCGENESYCLATSGVSSRTHYVDKILKLPFAKEPEKPDHLAESRAHRDRLLTASDWTQVPDNRLSPEQRAAWAKVREEWRSRVDDIKAGIPPRPWAEEPE